MADGAQIYAYGSPIQVLTENGLETARVIGSKENGRMLVKMQDRVELMTVAPFGNAWIPEVQ